MSDDPVQPAASADDLLGRWFAHHDKTAESERTETPDEPTADDAAPPRRIPLAARPSEAAARMTRPSAAAVLAELREAPAVERSEAVRGVVPPSTVSRGLPGSAHSGPTGAARSGADGDVPELDRPSPVGFEPVLLASVRKKNEPKEQEKKGGRLSRLKSRVVGPLDEPGSAEEGDAATEADDATSESSPDVEAPTAPRAPLALEDVIALATAASFPVTEPRHEVEPVLPSPDTEPAPLVPEPEPVVPEPEPQPEVEPVLPSPDTEPAPVVPEPEVEPVLPSPDTEPAPVVPEPEPVVPEPEPQPEVEPVLPSPDTEPEPVVTEADSSPAGFVPRRLDDRVAPAPDADPLDVPAKRRLLSRTKRSDPQDPEERKRRPLVARSQSLPTTSTASAARGLLAAARSAPPAPHLAPQTWSPPAKAEPAPERVPEPVPAPAPVAAQEPRPAPVLEEEPAAETAAPAGRTTEMPAIYQFAPLKSGRRFLSLMLLTGLVASGYLGYGAYQSRETIEMGVAAIVTLVTLVIWAIRAGATVTVLTVRRGQLEISRQGGRMVFDLTSTYTPIEVVGRPGSKNWKVLFIRRGVSPVAVDSTMVDAVDFMRVLKFYRPNVGREDSPQP